MKISDEISLSARNLLRRKGRTALTLVGVVIGTCMVVLMISLGIAQTKTNEEMLQSWGDLTQVQIYGYGTMVGSDGKVTVTATDKAYCGRAFAAAGSSDATAKVMLNFGVDPSAYNAG